MLSLNGITKTDKKCHLSKPLILRNSPTIHDACFLGGFFVSDICDETLDQKQRRNFVSYFKTGK